MLRQDLPASRSPQGGVGRGVSGVSLDDGRGHRDTLPPIRGSGTRLYRSAEGALGR